MIWSSRARNKSAPPLSRRSRGRIESPAPEASGARESELSIRVNPSFRFCKEIDPNTPKPGKIQTHDSRRCPRQSPLSAVFHGRLPASRLARSIQRLLTRGLVLLVDDIDQIGLKRQVILAFRRLSMGAKKQPVFPFGRQR